MNPAYAQYYGREYVAAPPTQQPAHIWEAPNAVRRFFRVNLAPQPSQAAVPGLVAPLAAMGNASTLAAAAPPPTGTQNGRPYRLLRAPTLAEGIYGLGN